MYVNAGQDIRLHGNSEEPQEMEPASDDEIRSLRLEVWSNVLFGTLAPNNADRKHIDVVTVVHKITDSIMGGLP